MLHKNFHWFAGVAVSILVSTAALAHHGISTKFDQDQTVTLKGRVTKLDWANPHAHIFMLVKDGTQETPWYVELESPQLLELNGWAETVLKPGDTITVQGFSARDNSFQVWGDTVIIDSSGQSIFGLTKTTLFSTITDQPAQETPRWPDGTPRLGAPPGEVGYWVPSTSVLMEDGTGIAMAANGQLENIADAAKVAPLQTWALRLYEKRQREFLANDPTYLECRPPAGPRKFLEPYGIQLLEDKPMQRIFVIAGGGNHDWQLIYTDGRANEAQRKKKAPRLSPRRSLHLPHSD